MSEACRSEFGTSNSYAEWITWSEAGKRPSLGWGCSFPATLHILCLLKGLLLPPYSYPLPFRIVIGFSTAPREQKGRRSKDGMTLIARSRRGLSTWQGLFSVLFVFLFFCIERRAEIRKCSLLVPTIKLSNARGEERSGERKSWWFGHFQDSGEEILEMKCLGRLQRKYRNFQTSKCPKHRERSQHRVKWGKLRVSI